MTPRDLPAGAHALLAAKGPENAARVRRVVQLVSAVHALPDDWHGLRVLDLGCGEGLFAIEAACQGAEVVAVDGREQRMAQGRALAAELRLDRLRFLRADVRTLDFEALGTFDVVLMLGLLYHLDAPDVFRVVHRAANATRRTLVVETHVAPDAGERVEHEGRTYRGWRYREHRPEDDARVRDARLLASLDGETSFWLAPESLHALLGDAGLPTVLECRAPPCPSQAADRVTLVALRGGRPALASCPWIDTAGPEEVAARARSPRRAAPMPPLDTARERAHAAAVGLLGAWARERDDVVFGFRTDAAPAAGLWRRADLAGYAGGLRRVPPLLAVLLGAGASERATAADLLDAGAGAAWLIDADDARVVVRTRDGETVVERQEPVPAPPGLPALTPRAADLLGLTPGA